MKKKVATGVVIVLVAFLGLAGVKALQIRALIASGENMMIPPERVTSAAAREESWPRTLSAVGSVAPVQGTMISAELAGTVERIAFESGTAVKAGDLLVQLDISAEKALMLAAEAQLELARLDLQRARDLRATKTIAQSELDSTEAKFKAAQAAVAQVDSTLAKKTIRAPFAGQVGIREVNPGQFIGAGMPIVSLQSIERVYVNFSLPQQEIEGLAPGLEVRVTTDAFPGKEFRGQLTAINPDLDEGTRSLQLQATLENKDGLLRSGMFAKVNVVLPGEAPVLVIPATAVLAAPYGDSVYVIEPKKDKNGGGAGRTIRQQFVRSGKSRGDFVEILSGLQPGVEVVSTGVFKLRNGMDVEVDNTLAPKAELAPTPADS